ncbi:FecCD family ABC transporter permease [Pararhodobacter zhoushanensis]|uniref:FecCD family ABC transporter permease n=1 Tax=Pararhodobacter zhoushanensis TaxID=2479545 RepID=UPI000F8F6F8D|nr:iron ABC transporter permease [Pararhodobacter zhoushanensis]
MVAIPSEAPMRSGDRSPRARAMLLALVLLLAATGAASLAVGAAGVSPLAVLGDWLAGAEIAMRERVILFDIRLPRLITGMLVGASLAVSGAVLQGLFRNPLADPGIIGVSAGAGLGAVFAIVLGGLLPFGGPHLVPLAAFVGGWGVTMLLYAVSTRAGRTSVATMLLAGIALAALAGAGMGVMIARADDAQLRDLTFWNLGSLAGASWAKLAVAAPVMLAGLAAAPFLARGLNALSLGEAAAMHLGIRVQRVKALAVLSVAASVGAAVAISGGIGFVGIVVPHLLRLAIGPDHRFLLPGSALLGAVLLLGADMISRVVVAPAELPIGIVTALAGAPVFLWLLLRKRGLVDL